MSQEFQAVSERKETEPQIAFQRPLGVDLFYAGDGNENNLPPSVLEHPRLLKEASERRELYSSLGDFFASIPDPRMDVSEAMHEGLVTPESTAGVYSRLSDFLETDENNARLILYLPSQLLPDRNVKKESPELEESEARFEEVYRGAWAKLLFESDLRASFVDGDDLEPGMGEPARVRKAAHLIPDMIEKGLTTFEEVTRIAGLPHHPELTSSLTEGIQAAREKQKSSSSETKPELVDRVQFLHNLDTIDETYAPTSEYGKALSPARAAWEKSVAVDRAIESAASSMAEQIIESGTNDLLSQASNSGHEVALQRLSVRTIRKMGESFAARNTDQAKHVASSSWEALASLWEKSTPTVKEEIMICGNYWVRMGIIEKNRVTSLGISIPDLTDPFPVAIEELITDELPPSVRIAEDIAQNPTLADIMYPCVMLNGSRVKGYGTPSSDIDASIFIKPNASWENHDEMIATLTNEVPGVKELGFIKEYWTTENNGRVTLRPVPEGTRNIAGLQQIHFFMGGVWIGNTEEYQKVSGDVVEDFLDLGRFGAEKEDVRFQLTRRLENDMLLTRLAHKGYRKFYPLVQDEKRSSAINGESDFWDPGYRRVATQLFISRVFLPDLSATN